MDSLGRNFGLKRIHKRLLSVVLAVLFLSSIVYVFANDSTIPDTKTEMASPLEISALNDVAYDSAFTKEYMYVYKNFSDVKYESLSEKKIITTSMKVGNVKDNTLGVDVSGEKFIVHLLDCDMETESCYFRVNGVATGPVYIDGSKADGKKSFAVDSTHNVKIKSIVFNYCDERRFCDVPYEAYNLVEVMVE